jgi:hypothetical protein
MTTPKRATTCTVTRHYAPDLARQVQALLRLLAYRTGESAADRRHEEGERVDETLPAYEGNENEE